MKTVAYLLQVVTLPLMASASMGSNDALVYGFVSALGAIICHLVADTRVTA